VYHIDTEDFYVDLAANRSLLDRIDTANHHSDHPYYIADRQKTPGLYSDKTDGQIMIKFCVVSAKSYAVQSRGRKEY